MAPVSAARHRRRGGNPVTSSCERKLCSRCRRRRTRRGSACPAPALSPSPASANLAIVATSPPPTRWASGHQALRAPEPPKPVVGELAAYDIVVEAGHGWSRDPTAHACRGVRATLVNRVITLAAQYANAKLHTQARLSGVRFGQRRPRLLPQPASSDQLRPRRPKRLRGRCSPRRRGGVQRWRMVLRQQYAARRVHARGVRITG